MRRMLMLTIILGPWLTAAPAAEVDTAQDGRDQIIQELISVNRSLEELVKVVTRLAESQESDTLVKRLDIEERTVLALQSDLTQAREARDTAESELRELRDSIVRVDSDEIRGNLVRGIPVAERRLATLKERVRALEEDVEARRKAINELKQRLDGTDDADRPPDAEEKTADDLRVFPGRPPVAAP